MKKRLLLLMVIVVMSAGMVACGNEETKENVADNEVQEESVESEVTETTQTPTEDSDEDVSKWWKAQLIQQNITKDLSLERELELHI